MSGTEERYRGLAGRRYHEGKRQVPEAAYAWVARSRARKLARFVRLDDVVLEYGVGYGWNLAALPCQRRLGFDIADGVESQVRQHGIEFFPEEQLLPPESADVILCYHTLEHVLHPPATLEALRRWLRPAGRVVIFVPWERERRLARFRPGEPNHHLYTWSPQSLGNLVEDCGYQVSLAGAGVYGYDRFASLWANRLRLGEAGFKTLRKLLQGLRPLRESYAVASPRKAEAQIAD
jgi:SAM-dependent methyltransferase